MASGNLLDLNAVGEHEDPGIPGRRPFLSRFQIGALRALILLYALTCLFLAATNFRPVGNAVFRLASEHFWVAATVGILVMLAVLTFCLLLAMSLRHFLGTHAGERPARWWLWVIILLNVVGVVAYYLRIIEPEQRALGHFEPGA